MNKFLSVIIPTFNEIHRLPQTLEEIIPYLNENFPQHEILIVDDNSPDRTADFVEKIAINVPTIELIVQPKRFGKGASVRRGCLNAKGDYVLFMDADHSTPIQELDRMIKLLEEYNSSVVVGVRTYQEDESRWRRVIGLSLQLLAHIFVFRKAVIDSQCGFKLFTREAVLSIFPYCRIDGGMLDIEIFFLIHKRGIECFYNAVHWKNKPGSRISIIKSIIFDPIDMFSIRFRDAFGIYNKPIRDERQPWNQ
jgi:dolichyl-phosphate beta-glucosyltransferase